MAGIKLNDLSSVGKPKKKKNPKTKVETRQRIFSLYFCSVFKLEVVSAQFFEHPGLVKGVPALDRIRWSFKSLPTQSALWFYGYFMLFIKDGIIKKVKNKLFFNCPENRSGDSIADNFIWHKPS